MRAVVITKTGGYDVLQVQERPEPQAGPGQVVIDVAAAGVNFADTMARVGLYPDAPKLPAVVGYEVSGTISAVGDGVDPARVGARVMAGTRFGGYSEQVVVKDADAVAFPDRLSFAEAAAIPVNYATAWAGLIGYGSLRAGEKVLVHAAAGGVGIAATQIAKSLGPPTPEVWGTASPSKHDRVRENGVDHPLTYDQAAGVPKMDLIMDAIGGHSLPRSYKSLRAGGRLVAFGASSVQTGEHRNLLKAAPQALRMLRGINAMDAMQQSKALIGLNMLTLWDDRGTLEPWLTPLQDLLDRGVVQPVVAAEVPFAQAGEAHRMLAERRNVGKVVLVP